MRATVNGRELRDVIAKVKNIVPAKASFSPLQKMYFEVKDGIFRVWGTTADEYLSYVVKAYDVEDGIASMSLEQLKLLSKTDGVVQISVQDEHIIIKFGKKTIEFDNQICDGDLFRIPDDMGLKIATFDGEWLLETINDLKKFTDKNSYRDDLKGVNINTKLNRFEACDAHRICVRYFEQDVNGNTSVLLNQKTIDIISKLKYKNDVAIYENDKIISLMSEDFAYFQKKLDTVYVDISRIYDNIEYKYEVNANYEELKEVVTYNSTIKSTKPTIFLITEGELYSYYAPDVVIKDNIKADISFSNDIMIALNHNYVKDMLDVISYTNKVDIEIIDSKSPIKVEHNDYGFLILPVNIKDYAIDEIKKKVRE